MIKLKYLLFIPLFFVLSANAQQNPSFWVNKAYRTGITLLANGQYVAAGEQFRLVENAKIKPETQAQFQSELSLLKKNSQYYEALCALNLGNDDAESMFLRFIKEHP